MIDLMHRIVEVDSGRLLASSLMAFGVLAAMSVLLVRGRYWSTPDQRSVMLITFSVTGLAGEAVVRRLGMPDPHHFTIASTLYLVIAVATAYRFKVLLDNTRSTRNARTGRKAQAPAETTPDAAIMWRSMRRMTLHIQQMAPCDNPDCNAARRQIIELTAQLERGHRA